MHSELLRQKLAQFELSLSALEAVLPARYDDLYSEPLLLPAIERHYQLMVDSAVDCNNLLLEAAGVDKSESYFGSFTALRDRKLIAADVADSLAPSVGLRNALVHRYETIDRQRMFRSLQKFLPLYREYLQIIVRNVR